MAAIRQAEGSRYSRIHGVGAYRPARIVPNSEIVDLIDSSDEWIRSRSGVETRHIAAPEESVVDMASEAAIEALAHAGVHPDQVGAVITATVTHPYQTPSAASAIAHRIGATPAAAMDLSAACAGYCHGIALADAMVRGGTAEYVLVVGVEKLSDFTDPHDRGTAFIFGDGAGAAVVGPSEIPGIGPTVWGSDGSNWDLIRSKDSWTDLRRQVSSGELALEAEMPWSPMTMQGPSVFRWAVYSMAPVAQQALEAAGITAADLGAFIPHQANLRIVDALVKQLKLPDGIPVADDIRTSANTSSASIPLATERMLRTGEAKSGDLALQIGFGAGLAYAAQVIVLP